MNLIKSSIALLISSVLIPVHAANLSDAQAVQSKTNQASAVSQKRIDVSAEKTLTLEAEIAQLQEEVANLKIYRDHLTSLVDSQNQEVDSLNEQIEQIAQTRQGIVPLMYHMLDGLKTIVANDKPIRKAQREERIAKLDAMMTRADVADAEKFRRILEAYQIEMDYGSRLGVYQGKIHLAAGEQIEADVLYLGRVSLIARSLSGEAFWSWSNQQRSWQPLGSEQKTELDKAFAMANKQIAPSMLTLPVSLTVAEGK
jgi:septal ring factor EnvC (AmiA/AmiB activator)